jgi:hypothetical protein
MYQAGLHARKVGPMGRETKSGANALFYAPNQKEETNTGKLGH